MYDYSKETEVWEDVEGFEGKYQVSNLGRVKSLERTVPRSDGQMQFVRERVLKQRLNNSGYSQVNFGAGGKRKRKVFFVHRLVAKAFLDNVECLETVNHKDGDKQNNRVDNLEWASRSENTRHAYDSGLMSTKVAEVTLPNGERVYFNNLIACSRHFGYDWSWVQHHREKKGNPFNHKGYTIKVID